LILKDLPLVRHELARGAHEAARCAGAAGHYWAYHDRLYAAQAAFARDQLIRYAAELGLDTAGFTRCLDRHQFAAAVDEDVEQARALGIRATPSFLVNGRSVVGALPIESFRRIVDDLLAEQRGRQ
jgi:protein-disulfide isomerase